MMKILNMLSGWFVGLFRVWRREFSHVFRDQGVMLFFLALPTIYPLVYALIYNPELIRDVAVVVVDNSRTAESRHLVRMLDATEPVGIVGYAANKAEAKRAMHEKKCYGVVEIPADYARRIGRGETANVSFYCDMSLLLRYRQFTMALTQVQIAAGAEIQQRTLADLGLPAAALASQGAPLNVSQQFVGDPSQGFSSFIMPGILMLILQQSVVLGACMIAGAASERRRRNGGSDPLGIDAPATATVVGKTLCYVAIMLPMVIYTLHVVPWIFKFPAYGSIVDELLFVVPYLLAVSVFGLTLSVFVTERESSFLVIVFTSVIFLFLSGLTWPRYAMSGPWQLIGACVPATWGVQGFVHINSDNASLALQSASYTNLWILTAVYFVAASIIFRFHRPKRLA